LFGAKIALAMEGRRDGGTEGRSDGVTEGQRDRGTSSITKASEDKRAIEKQSPSAEVHKIKEAV
jgi:hypothetical protein